MKKALLQVLYGRKKSTGEPRCLASKIIVINLASKSSLAQNHSLISPCKNFEQTTLLFQIHTSNNILLVAWVFISMRKKHPKKYFYVLEIDPCFLSKLLLLYGVNLKSGTCSFENY